MERLFSLCVRYYSLVVTVHESFKYFAIESLEELEEIMKYNFERSQKGISKLIKHQYHCVNINTYMILPIMYQNQ